MRKGIDYPAIGVCVMCHDGNGKYLVGQRSPECKDEHFTWHPIGTGGIESHEAIPDAARREVKEECGADIIDLEFMGFREIFREHEGNKTHWVMFDYKARVNPEQVEIKEPDKCLEFRWCTVSEIPEPQHSTFPDFLKKYKEIL